MAKPTQLWPGERMRTFFRSIFRGESGVSDELADRLADICERHINRMLVWNDEPTPVKKPAPQPAPAIVDDPVEDVTATEAGAPWSAEHLEDIAQDLSEGDGQDAIAVTNEAEPFDPFAFSVIVILARSGAKALKARLEEIEKADHLRELANAQHLGVEPNVRSAAKLRNAIVSGAKQRLADRRAAAS